MLAAEMLGRKAYCFEINKEYVDGVNIKLPANVQTTVFNMMAEEQQIRKQKAMC